MQLSIRQFDRQNMEKIRMSVSSLFPNPKVVVQLKVGGAIRHALTMTFPFFFPITLFNLRIFYYEIIITYLKQIILKGCLPFFCVQLHFGNPLISNFVSRDTTICMTLHPPDRKCGGFSFPTNHLPFEGQ